MVLINQRRPASLAALLSNCVVVKLTVVHGYCFAKHLRLSLMALLKWVFGSLLVQHNIVLLSVAFFPFRFRFHEGKFFLCCASRDELKTRDSPAAQMLLLTFSYIIIN